MSSTNRSNARDNHISDYYVTPISDVELFLKNFNEHVKIEWNEINILDPCAGGNKEVKDEHGIKEIYHAMSYPTAISNIYGKCNITTMDIREDSLAEHCADYLETELENKPNLIITNPPFASAIKIIEKALSDVENNGYVIMLLRLNFFGSKDRKKFFEKYMPEWCFVHHVRIGFCDKKDKDGYVMFDKNGNVKHGSTDSIEYAHFVFRKNYNPDYTKLVLI
ncbi:hypothetical protein [Blautia hansenii]|uniref:Uncharacterized protein n=1 Tax=Blautia hansenii DSM 20583 TaxID=537007 RepID=C9L7Z0_BLAHA|nr:hypothetical protein [Blautia hansenii]ASM69711.1 hypothetical protein CGC63_09185 [Blautia hansenii DSM 20583]EEX21885.1 hypothetical protein BLAHAN_05513 [Blautia hansenii DSM 20583]UWO09458.1 hypothetical protein NQ538_09185 [Blautia hansenii DSM 20583]